MAAGDDRPKSPWTPSYSVTHQGNTPLASPAHTPKELDEVEQLPPPVQEKPTLAAPTTEVRMTRSTHPKIVVSNHSHPQTANGESAQEPPARPWTPSYSVTRQGPSSDIGADEEPSASAEKAETAPEGVTTNGNGANTQSFPTSEEPKITTK